MKTAIGASFQNESLFWLVFGLLAGASLMPLFVVEFLPFLDWPQHLGMVSFLRYQSSDLWGFSNYAVAHNNPVATYVVFYYLTAWLSYLMPVGVAGKVMLGLYIVGTPLSAVYMLRSFRLSAWPSLLIFVVMYNWPLYMGFVPYVLSFPFLCWGVGLMVRMSRGFRWSSWWTMVAVSVVLFYSHVFAYLTVGFLAVVVVVFYRFRSFKQRWYTSLSWVPSMGLLAVWMYQLLLSRSGGPALQASASGDAHLGGGWWKAQYRPVGQKLSSMAEHLNESFHGAEDLWVVRYWLICLGWMILCGLLLRVVRWFRSQPNVSWPWWPTSILVLGMFGLYMAMPMGLFGVWWALSPRLVPLVALLAILLVPPLFQRSWKNLFVVAPVIALTLYSSNLTVRKYRVFESEARQVNNALQAIPNGARVYGLIYNAGSHVMSNGAFLHFPVYYLVKRGGLVGFSHFHYAVMPASFKNASLAPYPGHRAEWEPWRWKYDIYGLYYDYILTKGSGFWYQTRSPRSIVNTVTKVGDWGVYFNPKASRQWPLFSFRDNLHKAIVTERDLMTSKRCLPKKGARYECPHKRWMVVQPTQTHLGGVHVPCIWAHPGTGKTIVITFHDLPPQSDQIAGVMGVADSGFPGGRPFGAPVDMVIRANDTFVRRLRSNTRKGYIPYHLKLPKRKPWESLKISFEIQTSNDAVRHFCFTGALFQSQTNRPFVQQPALPKRTRPQTRSLPRLPQVLRPRLSGLHLKGPRRKPSSHPSSRPTSKP